MIYKSLVKSSIIEYLSLDAHLLYQGLRSCHPCHWDQMFQWSVFQWRHHSFCLLHMQTGWGHQVSCAQHPKPLYLPMSIILTTSRPFSQKTMWMKLPWNVPTAQLQIVVSNQLTLSKEDDYLMQYSLGSQLHWAWSQGCLQQLHKPRIQCVIPPASEGRGTLGMTLSM